MARITTFTFTLCATIALSTAIPLTLENHAALLTTEASRCAAGSQVHGCSSAAAVRLVDGYSVPGAGTFTNHAGYTFNTSLPSGLQYRNGTVSCTGNGCAPYNRTSVTSNVAFSGGFANLKVPGGQTQSLLQCNAIQTSATNIFYASVRTKAIMSGVPGTCVGIFFYQNYNQETEIEYLSNASSTGNPGNSQHPLHFTNQATSPSGSATTGGATALSTANTAVHEYRLDWIQGQTLFYIDSVSQTTFTKNMPSQPGPWVWNNWANSAQDWSTGPSLLDKVFQIQSIVMYYNTSS